MSSAVRAMGPSTCRESHNHSAGYVGPSTTDGRRPTTPQNEAGMRREPPRAVPSARGIIPVTRPAAPPPVEPPAVRLGSHGFRVGPKTLLKVAPPAANSGQLVLPRMTAPAARSRCTTSASSVGTWSRYNVEPYVVRSPATGVTSLMPTGRPPSRPMSSPRTSRRSSSWASSRARGLSVTIALMAGLQRSTRARQSFTTSTGEILRDRTSRARSLAERSASSSILPGTRPYPETSWEPLHNPVRGAGGKHLLHAGQLAHLAVEGQEDAVPTRHCHWVPI